MEIALILFGLFSLLCAVFLMADFPELSLFSGGIALCCLVIIFTVLGVQSTCDDYGSFKVGNSFYQCQLVKEDK